MHKKLVPVFELFGVSVSISFYNFLFLSKRWSLTNLESVKWDLRSPTSTIKDSKLCPRLRAGLGLCSSVFRANHSFFAQKWANEPFAQKNEQFTRSLIFGELPERFAHDRSFPLSESLMVAHFWWATWAIRSHRSFLVSDLSDLLTSLTKKEGMSD